jgi:spermidine synthase
MTSRTHGSEEALARVALRRVAHPRDVLVGGLGMGFTLRAALDRLPSAARVWVAELVPELVAWNRAWLAHLAGRPLDDPRVRILEADVGSCLRERAGAFDAVLLDVDNGPAASSTAVGRPANGALYGAPATRALRTALRPGGVVAVWSAGPAPRYLRVLAAAGLDASQETARARGDRGGRRDVILVGVRPGGHDRGQAAG